ncbi:MAG: hypothetical protein LBU34_06865 [Planctomycetaceae bacterium]|nr:hypothetical protein [Planctomycetaceae bacterium]
MCESVISMFESDLSCCAGIAGAALRFVNGCSVGRCRKDASHALELVNVFENLQKCSEQL